MAKLYKRIISYWDMANKRLEKRTLYFKSRVASLNFDVTTWANYANIQWDSISESIEETNLPSAFIIRAISRIGYIPEDSEKVEVTSNE